jgi:hypothetical protein
MASASVNRPTNVQQKEQDVNNKLQLFGIYSGMLLRSPEGPGPLTPRFCSVRERQGPIGR